MGQPKRYFSLEQEGSNVDIEIYGDVTSWPWVESDVSSYNLAQQIKGLKGADTITVGINSYGGEVSEGLAIYNALKNSPAKVVTRCDGFACSVASVIFMAGDERIMNESSLLMIHNAWTYAQGDASELRKQADDLEKITEQSVKIYLNAVSIEEDELRQLMAEETWLDSQEALDMGFATAIEKDPESDKASQSIRRSVMQMLKNPYQLEEEDPDEDKEPGTDTGTDSDTGTDTGSDDTDTGTDTGTGTDEQPDDGGEGGDGGEQPADDPENPDDDPEKDDDAMQQQTVQFLNAIFH